MSEIRTTEILEMLIAKRTPTHTAITVGAATTVIAAANANRKYLLMVNDSNEDIYIKLGAPGVLNEGIRINLGGGNYEISIRNGNSYLGAINGICASGAKILLVTEEV